MILLHDEGLADGAGQATMAGPLISLQIVGITELRCLYAARKAVLIGGDSARYAATGKRPSDGPKKHHEESKVSGVHPADHCLAPRFGFGGKMPVPVIGRFMPGPVVPTLKSVFMRGSGNAAMSARTLAIQRPDGFHKGEPRRADLTSISHCKSAIEEWK